jgi:signal transduction histidine kinase
MQSSGETNADRVHRDIEPARLVDQRAQASAIEAQLREEIERLKEANQRKDEFLATLAHQLRNPLAPIRNALSFMQVGGNDASAWARGVTIIDRQLANLTCLVDDLLDLSRIARGVVELHKQPTPLSAILDGALETSRPVMEAAGHALAMSGAPSVWLDVDGTRITQALANVLNNAAKYTPPGGKICVMAVREGSTVAMHVEDTGHRHPAARVAVDLDVFTQIAARPAPPDWASRRWRSG